MRSKAGVPLDSDCVLVPDHRPRDARGRPAAQRGPHPCPTQRRPQAGGAETGGDQREALPGAFLRQQANMVSLKRGVAEQQSGYNRQTNLPLCDVTQ